MYMVIKETGAFKSKLKAHYTLYSKRPSYISLAVINFVISRIIDNKNSGY